MREDIPTDDTLARGSFSYRKVGKMTPRNNSCSGRYFLENSLSKTASLPTSGANKNTGFPPQRTGKWMASKLKKFSVLIEQI